MQSVLDGLLVLDFSHALAGPYCTMLLADYGATVYKIESPEGGDVGRSWGPPYTGEDSSYFLGLNASKQGVAIDLKKPEGVELCRKLIGKADVLIENMRPGVMDRLGLSYSAARARNPRLIYCSISGYGQNGPRRDDAAMDLILQASSGLISVTGTPEGHLARCGHSVADITSGMFALIGILMALRVRDRTGEGQFVDVSMFDSMVSAMASNFANFLGSGTLPKPMGTAFPTIVPYAAFPARDREIVIAVASEKLWQAFCPAIGHPELAAHPDYATNAVRVKNRAVLEPLLGEILSRRTCAEWTAVLQSAGIPCTPIRDLREVVEDPQSQAREMFVAVDGFTVTGVPVKLPAAPGRVRHRAPRLGEHTREILSGVLGLNAEAIEALAKDGVIPA
ncbi:MAG: CoA transferase [Bryobacteraceae bacterium]|nr:CoA transferase [Bryobacteraceae bacterium]